jgi:hypothetical protein
VEADRQIHTPCLAEIKMGILLAFAPFLVFAVADRFVGPMIGLFLAAATSAVLLARDVFKAGRTPKILEIGTFILFGGMMLYERLGHPDWSIIGVRLRVDVGLLLIVLISMAIGRPFTLQYAREQVPQEHWSNPVFVRTNYVISAVWALAFAVMVVAEWSLLYVPALPRRVGIIAIIAALIGAVKFTGWYPERVKQAYDGLR